GFGGGRSAEESGRPLDRVRSPCVDRRAVCRAWTDFAARPASGRGAGRPAARRGFACPFFSGHALIHLSTGHPSIPSVSGPAAASNGRKRETSACIKDKYYL